ncbi:MAG: alpha/beta hydrolase, partial [Kiritimatiellae bacterium]|nr:alpha/beta hydrolase [Kiritimatiellia bacterium]
CVHDIGTSKRFVSLPVGSGADDLSFEWSWAANGGVENIPPRSARITASFDARQTRTITYALSHPNRLFGQAEYSQTVRFCPRPPDPDPDDPDPEEEPSWYSEGDSTPDWDPEPDEEDDPEEPNGAGDGDEVCPVHEVPYEQCASLHESDYTNAVQNVAHLGGVLCIRDPPVTGDQIYLEVPNEHVNCCGCPDHWTNCVSVAYRSPCVRVTGPGGQDFTSTDVSCTVDVAGVHPSRAVGDAGLAFARNGEIYERRDYTTLGVAIRHDGVPLSQYNERNRAFGFPMTVCTNDWRAPELELVTNVRLPSGTVHLEFAGATAPFALWYRRRGESEYRKLLDSETCPVKDIPIGTWRRVVAGVAAGRPASVPVLVTSSAPGTVRLVLRYWTADGGAFVEDSAVQRITSLNPALLADADGDWSLGEGDVAAQLEGRMFRFWTNEDIHKGDYVGQSSDLAPNASDYVVNGRLDLMNLFPVKLDLKPFVDAWGQSVTFILWSPESGSLRFCGLDAQPDEAWSYQTNDVYTTTGDPVYAADLIPVSGDGEEIDPGDYLGLGNAPGVLAFEAASEVLRPDALMLLVTDGDDVLFSYGLPLAVFSVDRMYRWRGLRQVCGGSSSIPDRTGEPWHMTDADAADVDVFFLHGFNVSESDARNWSRQVFKRLWLSGSRARFHGFSWYGDYNLIGSTFNGLHYHQDVYHALKTASAFKSHVEAAQPDSSKRVIMAHSLGNMVAAEALRQGLAVGKYFMFNAAVASEAIDGTLQAASTSDEGYLKYVPSDWHGYTNMCWAANWHRWFQGDATDARGRMGWPDYFSDALTNAVTVCNYYSSGDEIFEEMPSTPSALSGVLHWPTFQSSWPFVDLSSMFTPSVNAWQKQEVLKGVDAVAGTLAGGWGFHVFQDGTQPDPSWRTYSEQEACLMVEDGSIVTNAVFARNATAMFNSSATQDAQWETLAKYVPAVSGAVGKRSIFAVYGRDIDMNLDSEQGVERLNGWGRNNPQYGASWLHSDMKNMAYWYVFPLYRHLKEELR